MVYRCISINSSSGLYSSEAETVLYGIIIPDTDNEVSIVQEDLSDQYTYVTIPELRFYIRMKKVILLRTYGTNHPQLKQHKRV